MWGEGWDGKDEEVKLKKLSYLHQNKRFVFMGRKGMNTLSHQN